MEFILGIDIGGTFTDAFATDDSARVVSAKAPSTPDNYARGVIDAIDELALRLNLETEALLASTSYICHGTTASLNSLVTGTAARVGFMTTCGHGDSIVIMNGEGRYAGLGPEQIQDFTRTNKPAPLIRKQMVKEIDERVDYKGAEILPLNEDVTRAAVRELLDDGAAAIAVSLLWSFRNPAHENRVREIIHEAAPDLYVSLSSEVCPRIREYPRSVTTIMNGQVGPALRSYLRSLEDELKRRRFGGLLLVMQGSGGTIAAETAPRQAITTIGSVLVGGVVGCVNLGESLDHKNIISTDMGGTTFLVGLVVDGKPVTATTAVINQYTLNLPMVKVAAIGSGGGTIAWLDQGANLHVGPRSAGAAPGPACYGAGGAEPTITDADLILGILNPDFFLGGRKRLRRDLAEQAIRGKIAEPLKMSIEDAAATIYSIANAQASDLVRKVVVNSGYDPRDFALYSFGGAGPVHCAGYSADLGVAAIVVPLGPTAAAFSAFGLAASNVGLTAEVSRPQNFPVSAEIVNETFDELEAKLRADLAEQRIAFAQVTFAREIDIRYTLQLAEVSTPVKNGALSAHDVAAIGDDFENLYGRLYGKGTGYREAGLQCITYRVFVTGYLPFKPSLPDLPRAGGGVDEAIKGKRRAMLDSATGWAETSVYDYEKLAFGHVLRGPAIVEAPTTTVAIPP
ncbi:MAG: hydantoinase/oxoprolinase family protein, partial [Candidatus Binataceae bacterium]